MLPNPKWVTEEKSVNLNISMASTKTPSASIKTAKHIILNPQVREQDYEVVRQNHRFVATWKHEGDAQDPISRIWQTSFFGTIGESGSVTRTPDMINAVERPPEIISVEFTKVNCLSVCGVSVGAFDRVIMVDPDDPRSRLFIFRLHVDTRKRSRSIVVSAFFPHITPANLENFLRVLSICTREFYQEKDVLFQSRKYIGRVKTSMEQRSEGGDAEWQRLVATEKRLQEG